MQIVIFSYPNDVHAIAVDWALRQRGARSRLVSHSDFPGRMTASIWVGDRLGCSIVEPETAEPITAARVVWNRRSTAISVPDEAHPADRRAILQQGTTFLRNFRSYAFEDAFWINDPASQALAVNKIVQLRAAREAALSVPSTLVSNDPDEIRAFIGEDGQSTITKPLSPLNWHGEGYVAASYTAEITLDDCKADEPVRWLPMIYQRKVEKDYELRVVVMGRSIFAVRINSQEIEEAKMDWRMAQSSPDLRFERHELDEKTSGRIFDFMDRLGIVFGSLDLIVCKNGDTWFLEVNEQGQFLFLEEIIQDLPLLDAFAQFCMSEDPKFAYVEPESPLSFNAFISSETWMTDQARRLDLHNPYEINVSEPE